MLKEKVFLIFFAILGGTLFSVGLFYISQKTSITPNQTSRKETPTPTPTPVFFLNIESPQNEEVFDKKIIPLSGKTFPQAQVLISSEDKDIVLTPAGDGSFSTNITLFDGVNSIEVVSLGPDFKTLKEKLTFTYSTEDF